MKSLFITKLFLSAAAVVAALSAAADTAEGRTAAPASWCANGQWQSYNANGVTMPIPYTGVDVSSGLNTTSTCPTGISGLFYYDFTTAGDSTAMANPDYWYFGSFGITFGNRGASNVYLGGISLKLFKHTDAGYASYAADPVTIEIVGNTFESSCGVYINGDLAPGSSVRLQQNAFTYQGGTQAMSWNPSVITSDPLGSFPPSGCYGLFMDYTLMSRMSKVHVTGNTLGSSYTPTNQQWFACSYPVGGSFIQLGRNVSMFGTRTLGSGVSLVTVESGAEILVELNKINLGYSGVSPTSVAATVSAISMVGHDVAAGASVGFKNNTIYMLDTNSGAAIVAAGTRFAAATSGVSVTAGATASVTVEGNLIDGTGSFTRCVGIVMDTDFTMSSAGAMSLPIAGSAATAQYGTVFVNSNTFRNLPNRAMQAVLGTPPASQLTITNNTVFGTPTSPYSLVSGNIVFGDAVISGATSILEIARNNFSFTPYPRVPISTVAPYNQTGVIAFKGQVSLSNGALMHIVSNTFAGNKTYAAKGVSPLVIGGAPESISFGAGTLALFCNNTLNDKTAIATPELFRAMTANVTGADLFPTVYGYRCGCSGSVPAENIWCAKQGTCIAMTNSRDMATYCPDDVFFNAENSFAQLSYRFSP